MTGVGYFALYFRMPRRLPPGQMRPILCSWTGAATENMDLQPCALQYVISLFEDFVLVIPLCVAMWHAVCTRARIGS